MADSAPNSPPELAASPAVSSAVQVPIGLTETPHSPTPPMDSPVPITARKGSGSQSQRRKRKLPPSSATRKSMRILQERTSLADAEIEDLTLSSDEPTQNRLPIPSLRVDEDYMRLHDLEPVLNLFAHQEWTSLLTQTSKVNLTLLTEFYNTLKVIESNGVLLGTFTSGGELHSFTSQNLAKWLGVPHTGFGEYYRGKWPADTPELNVRDIVSFVAEDSSAPISNCTAKSMGVRHRTLHRLLCANILPRAQKHAIILIQDFFILYHMLSQKPINLGRQVMFHMDQASSSGTSGMPYPGIVKTILTRCEAYSSEDEVDCWEPFGELNMEKMGWFFFLF